MVVVVAMAVLFSQLSRAGMLSMTVRKYALHY